MATPATSPPAAPTRYYTQQYDPSTGTYIYTGVGTTPVGAPISQVDPNPYIPRPPQMTQVIAPGVGRVAIPQPHGFPLKVREQVIQPNTSLDATIRTMSNHGVPPSDPGALMAIGMASGVAEGIGNIVRNKKGPVYITKEVVQNIEQNCKVDNFDFNIYGLTTAEILGTRFSNTTFQSEEARVVVAQAILQRVVDDPFVPDDTRLIALKELSHVDYPKQQKNAAQISALEASRLFPTEPRGSKGTGSYGSLVPPPAFGNRSTYDVGYLKSVYGILGCTESEKFTVGDPNCKPLKVFLPALVQVIQQHGLSPEVAYILLLSITTGDTNFQIRQAMYEDNIPFEEMWITLQKTSSRVPPIGGLQKELDEIFTTAPSSIEATLAKIQRIRAQMFSAYPDEQMKKAFITQSTTQDYINLIHTFFPSQAGRIEAAYDTKMEALNVEKELKERQGCLDTYHPPNEINILKELICSYLSRPFGISAGPSRLFGGAEVGSLSTSSPKTKVDMKPLEANSNDGSSGSNTNSNSTPGGDKRKNPNKAGYAKNPNINATTFYGGPPMQMQPVPIQQQTFYPPQPQVVPLMAVQAQPVQTQPIQQVPRPQEAYDPGRAQEDYLNGGASIIPKVCMDTLGSNRDTCFLCKGLGHWSNRCPIYPGEIPTTIQCQTCHGFHPTACKGLSPVTGNGAIGLSRDFTPGRLGYGNGYVANNRYVNNRPQGNNYGYDNRDRGPRNYNNRQGGRPYNPNYDPNRGPRNPGQGGYRRDDRRPYPPQQQQQGGYPQQQQMNPAPQVQQNYQGQQQNQQPPPQQAQYQQNMPQQQNMNTVYQPTQQPKAGTIGNHGIQPTPEGIYMNVMHADGQMQYQNHGQIQLQNQQPQNQY
jgi:hypothetical protein